MTTSNRDVVVNSDIVILTVKPYQVLQIMTEIQSIFVEVQSHTTSAHTAPKTLRPLIVSVASSVTVADIEKKVRVLHSAISLIQMLRGPKAKRSTYCPIYAILFYKHPGTSNAGRVAEIYD